MKPVEIDSKSHYESKKDQRARRLERRLVGTKDCSKSVNSNPE